MPARSSDSESDIEVLQQLTSSGGRLAALPTSTSANAPVAHRPSSAAQPTTKAGAREPTNGSPRKQGTVKSSIAKEERPPQASASAATPRRGGRSLHAPRSAGTDSIMRGNADPTLEFGSTDESADDRLPSPKSAFKPPRAVAKYAPRPSVPQPDSSSLASQRPRPAPPRSEPTPRFGAGYVQASEDSDDELALPARPAAQFLHTGGAMPPRPSRMPQRPAATASSAVAEPSRSGAAASAAQPRPPAAALQLRASTSASKLPPRSSAAEPVPTGSFSQPRPANSSSQPRPSTANSRPSFSPSVSTPNAHGTSAAQARFSRSPYATPRRPPPASPPAPAGIATARADPHPVDDSDGGSDIEVISIGGVHVASAPAPVLRRESVAQGAHAPGTGNSVEDRGESPARRARRLAAGPVAEGAEEARRADGAQREAQKQATSAAAATPADGGGLTAACETGRASASTEVPGQAGEGPMPTVGTLRREGGKVEVIELSDDSSDDERVERPSSGRLGGPHVTAEDGGVGKTTAPGQTHLHASTSGRHPIGFAGSSSPERSPTPPTQPTQLGKAPGVPAALAPRSSGAPSRSNGFAWSAKTERVVTSGFPQSRSPVPAVEDRQTAGPAGHGEIASAELRAPCSDLPARPVARRVSKASTGAGAAPAPQGFGGEPAGGFIDDAVTRAQGDTGYGASAHEADDDGNDDGDEPVSRQRYPLDKRPSSIISDSDESSEEDSDDDDDALPLHASLSGPGTARKGTGGRPPFAQRPRSQLPSAQQLVVQSAARERPDLAQAATAHPFERSIATSSLPVPIRPSVEPTSTIAPPQSGPPAKPSAARKSTSGRPPSAPCSESAQELSSTAPKRKAHSPASAAASDAEVPLRKRPKRTIERSKENLAVDESKEMPPPRRPRVPPSTSSARPRPADDDDRPQLVPVGVNALDEDEMDDPVMRARIEAAVEEFKCKQALEPSWKRQIAGPSYDIDDEFSTEIQDGVNRREEAWALQHPDEHPIRDAYKGLFEQMIVEANAQEYPPTAPDFRPKVRIVPPTGMSPYAWSSPPFEFIYTNRVVYSDGIVPMQALGCGCKGDCGEPTNRGKCACRLRQIEASRTREGGGQRSNHGDFAYEPDMRLNMAVMQHGDPIVECNSECGCSSHCINRVVGNRQGVSVDIFFTGKNGWGVRLPESYRDPILGTYSSRVVRRGEPLAIYAGELLRSKDAHARDELIYHYIKRNYIYDLDLWTIGEDIRALALPQVSNRVVVAKHESGHKTVQHAKGKEKPVAAPVGGVVEGKEEEEAFSSLFSVDAFTMGNWTRFANHVCAGFNVLPRPVFVDEGDRSRPLWVYFARHDIHPGDEINISYFGEEEPAPRVYGYTDQEWIRAANKERQRAPASHRCYCGKRLCRGRMFASDAPMFYETGEGRGVSG
ncbi:hypothetical protein JCM3770_004331 [Rhodotorula araucariae]